MNKNISSDSNLLILGLGSDILCDAGIGPALAHELYSSIAADEVDLGFSAVGGLDLLQLLKSYTKVLIIDGILSKSSPTGEIRVNRFPDCPSSLHLSNGHDADFSMLKEFAEISNTPFPEEIIFITVVVKDPFTVSDKFSNELTKNFEGTLQNILDLEEIKTFC